MALFEIEHFFTFSLDFRLKNKIKNMFLLSLDDILMILDQMAQLAQRRRNSFIRNRALLCSFFVILG